MSEQDSPTMLAARLHGPCDLRIERVPRPGAPGPGEALVRIEAVGICGSDLHTYKTGRIGDTVLRSPVIPGHEFGGIVEAVGVGAMDGAFTPLRVGARVAVDPAQACGRCDLCERGHPNLCRNLKFLGLWPDDGALCEFVRVPARCCFPVPAQVSAGEAAVLEALGVAVHAINLAKIRLGDRVAVLGAGPIGLCILQLARLAGASQVYVTEKLPWRLALAQRLGAAPVQNVAEVDIAIEAASADESSQQAADMLRPGGRLVLVGIPEDDRLVLRHSAARRKGLTIMMARRMKHAYPRAIELLAQRKVDLESLISHRLPLAKAGEAFAMNAAYAQGVVKVVVEVPGSAAVPSRISRSG